MMLFGYGYKPTPIRKIFNASTPSWALTFDKTQIDWIELDSVQTFAGQFDITMVTQGMQEDSSWVPLFGYSNTSNRALISGNTGKFAMNVGSGTLRQKTGITIDMAVKNTIRVYRDISNDIYLQINGETPINCFNDGGTFTLDRFGRTSARELTGIIYSVSYDSTSFAINEGSGSTLTASDGSTATINSFVGDSAYIDTMWTLLNNSGTPSVEVVNLGVGGNNTQNLIDRITDVDAYNPDLVVVIVGTNDALNATGNKILPVATYETNLTSIVQTLKGKGYDVVLGNVIACDDADLKNDHDYVPYYGAENTFNLNTDIIPTFNTAMQNVGTAESVPVVDLYSTFYADLSLISGDGTHPTATGYQTIADLVEPQVTGAQTIVCFGDSITAGVNVSGGLQYPARLSVNING